MRTEDDGAGFECVCSYCKRLRSEDRMARQARWGVVGLLIVGLLLIALTVSLTGCASSGLYQMSDSWCAAHPEASSARCAHD